MHELRRHVVQYLMAREKFLSAIKNEEMLNGNDNIIGRIGEFVAIDFLARQGRLVKKSRNKVEKGFDLMDGLGSKISVKVITGENTRGRTTQLKEPWTEFILITLNENYKVDRIGHILKDEFIKAVQSNFIRTSMPIVRKSMAKDRGLFEKFGRLYKDNDVIDYL